MRSSRPAARSAGATASSCARTSASSAPDAFAEPRDRRRRGRRAPRAVPSASAASVASTPSRRSRERRRRGGEHQLRVARRAVVVDAELARAARRAGAAPRPRRSRTRPRRPPCPAIRLGTAREADRRALDARVVAAVVLDHRAQHGVVGGQPGHADALALEVARARGCPAGRSPPPAGAGRARRRPRCPRRARAPGRGRGCRPPRCRRGPAASSFSESVDGEGTDLRCTPCRSSPVRTPRRCRRGRRWAGSRARAGRAARPVAAHRRRSRRAGAASEAARNPAHGGEPYVAETARPAAGSRTQQEVARAGSRTRRLSSPSSSARCCSSSSSRSSCRCSSPRRRQAIPNPFIDLSRDRPRARVRAVRADPDAGRGLGRALQPRRDRRDDARSARSSRSTRRSTSSSSSPGAVAGALLTKLLLTRRGQRGVELRRRRGLSDALDGKILLGMLVRGASARSSSSGRSSAWP